MYIELVKVLCCELATNGRQLPAFPLWVRHGFEHLITEVGGECVTTPPP